MSESAAERNRPLLKSSVPPAPSGGARKKGTGGEGALESGGRSERALTPPDKCAKPPVSNILPAAHADMRDGARSHPLFRAKSLPMRATMQQHTSTQFLEAARLFAWRPDILSYS